jgi:hypothetical protein
MKNMLPFIFFACVLGSNAQKMEKVLNLPAYESEPIHFGFSLMMNRSMLVPDQGSTVAGYQFYPSSGSGFGIGITSEYAFHKHFALRFIPDLSFLKRSLDYQTLSPNNTAFVRVPVESTIVNLPVNLKIKTTRFENFALYMLGGGRYVMDITKASPATTISLKRNEAAFDAGLGIDIYMIYFKCSAELKFIKGLTDQAIYNGGPSNSVNSIKSQCLVLSLNFEG